MISSDPARALYNQLSNFYLPALVSLKDDSLKKIMEQLKQGLDNVLSGVGSEQDDYIDERNVRNIFKPSDEFDFWTRVLGSPASN